MKGDIEVTIKRNGKLLFTVQEKSPDEAAKKTKWYLRNKLGEKRKTGEAANS